jgi:hypothetical protein
VTTPRQSRARRRPGFVAWLAIVALWLTIVAPVVSQVVSDPLDSLISIGACGVHHADGTQTPPTGHPLEKCGYCGLLAGHSIVPDAVPTLLSGVVPAHLWASALHSSSRGTIVLLAAAPRGPPSSSFRA